MAAALTEGVFAAIKHVPYQIYNALIFCAFLEAGVEALSKGVTKNIHSDEKYDKDFPARVSEGICAANVFNLLGLQNWHHAVTKW